MREGRACRDCCPWAAIAGAMNCDPPANHLHLHFYTSARPFRTTAGTPSPLLRPHARLASLGGCVATVATSATLPCTDTTARHRRYYCDRMRGSLRSGDESLRQILKWLNAIANRKSKNRKFPIPAIYISTLLHGHFSHDGEGAVATMPHDGGAPSLQCRTTAGRRRHYCDRLRGSLRSGDMSPHLNS